LLSQRSRPISRTVMCGSLMRIPWRSRGKADSQCLFCYDSFPIFVVPVRKNVVPEYRHGCRKHFTPSCAVSGKASVFR